MAKTREQKQQIVAGLTDKFQNMTSATFAEVSGLTMSQSDELRQKARESGAEVFIAKKTLLKLAIEGAKIENIDPKQLNGSVITAIADDEVAAAKLIKDFSKSNDSLTILAGILEGKGISAEEVNQLAALPGKEQLFGQLVGTLNAPISGFANVLAGNIRGLVTVLGAIQEQKA